MSNEASLPISTHETPLLQQHPSISSPPKHPRIKNLRAKTSFTLRILIVLVVGFIVIHSIYTKNRSPKPPHNSYLSGLSKYYCHLTRHHKLCHHSMPSIITNVTALQPNPARIFTASLQLVANELNHTTIAIAKALSSPSSNNTTTTTSLSTCQALVDHSLSRLNRSLALLGVDLFFGSFIPYLEEVDHNIRDEVKGVTNDIDDCLLGLGEIDHTTVGVEEVKSGVVKARRLAVNFIFLFGRRQAILDDFYNPFYIENEGSNYLYNYYYYFDYGHSFDYLFLVCLFGVMYCFLGLLYFLFWQQ